MNNRDNVSVDWILKELNLSDLPVPQAMSILLSYVKDEQLALYFSASLCGTDTSNGYEVIEHDPDRVDFLIANGESVDHDGVLRLLDGNWWHQGPEQHLDVIKYQAGNEDFYPTEDTGMYLVPVKLPLLSFYGIRADVEKFKSKVVAPVTTTKKIKARRQPEERGAEKALALLARENAENISSYRKGDNKVNTAAFHRHILKLADEMGVEHGYLESIEDKINRALNHYELKEIPPDRIKS